ncbi:MAG: flagellar hook-associated protein 3 [Gammaproteobacteria bacterium HGW-Gammaproteobacteria-3]|nr:MAG: flagellar hook-associated protein 3 [Gammaproteobacteria bacterium HGW-Gammaproteobacteria-3]
MRVSTAFSQQVSLNAMLAQQASLAKTQLQLSTGMKNLTPADDPAAATRVLDLQETIAKTGQFQDNIGTARGRLNIEEAALDTSENVLFRAKELTIQSLNAPLTANDRLAIKQEVDQLLQELVGVANTKNANGEFIFSGDLSGVPAFAVNPDTGRYVYQGGQQQRVLQIAPERQVADGDLGFNVFQNNGSVSQSGDAGVNGVAIDKRSVFDTLQTLSEALGSQFDIPEARLTGSRFTRFGMDYSAAPTSFTLTGDASTESINLSANFTSLDAVVTAINSQITPGSELQAQKNGNRIEFVSLTEGAASSVQITAVSGSFLTDFGFNSGDVATGANLGGVLTGSETINLPTSYSSNPAVFDVVAESGAVATVTLSSNHATMAALAADIQAQLTAAGLTDIEVDTSANPITFKSISTGSASSVQIKQVSGSFLSDAGFVTGQASRLFDVTANDVLTDLDTALDSLLKARTSVGARLKALDDQEAQNSQFVVDSQTTLSVTQDLDFAEAISRFNIQQTALQAAQQTFTRVQNLSLFSFL